MSGMTAGDGDMRLIHILFTTARPLGGVLLSATAALLAAWLRWSFIEPEKIGTACAAADAPWWCVFRQALMLATAYNLFGILPLAAAVGAIFSSGRQHLWAGHVALALGGVGLVLYNASLAAVAVVLAVLALAYRRERSM